MVINHSLNGMILQVLEKKSIFYWTMIMEGSETTVDGSEIPNNHLGCMKPCN